MMIPSDIITQILYRLPSKSIGRFRSVSKEWLFLLTQPEFIKTHRKTLNRNHHIFEKYDKSTSRYELYSHPFHDHDPLMLNPTKLTSIEFMDFRGSCNGIVLLSQRNTDYLDTLVLYNPTIREFVQLPQPVVGYYPYPPRNRESIHIDYTHGVGYDSVTDDYKVITLTHFDYHIRHDYGSPNQSTRTALRMSIYSLRSNTWRHLITDSPNYHCSYYSLPPVVHVNGFLHWLATKNKIDHSNVIVAFSLVDECFSEVPPPNLCNDTDIMSNEYCRLVLFGGKLGIYVNSQSKWPSAKFEFWLMNEYGVKESWTKIPLDLFDDEFPMPKARIFYDNGKVRVASKKKDHMLIYDFEKRTLSKNVYVRSRRFHLSGSYVESLVSLKRKDTTHGEQIVDSLTERQHAGSKAKKASLRKKHDEGKGKVKDEKRSKNSSGNEESGSLGNSLD